MSDPLKICAECKDLDACQNGCKRAKQRALAGLTSGRCWSAVECRSHQLCSDFGCQRIKLEDD